ncbi:hypothetical protein [Amycolatopsis sp. NPDC054798]
MVFRRRPGLDPALIRARRAGPERWWSFAAGLGPGAVLAWVPARRLLGAMAGVPVRARVLGCALLSLSGAPGGMSGKWRARPTSSAPPLPSGLLGEA